MGLIGDRDPLDVRHPWWVWVAALLLEAARQVMPGVWR